MGYVIVTAILAAIVALAVRSVWKKHKKGGCCGDCCSCHGKCG